MSKVYFAADHAGVALKHVLLDFVQSLGHTVEDLGAYTLEPDDDYPHYVLALAQRVSHEEGTFGIVIGGSGQGEAMCANRVSSVRAAVYYGPMRVTTLLSVEGEPSRDEFDAVRLPRLHNNANVLSIGARFVSDEGARQAVRVFLETAFSGAPRHVRRLAQY